MQSWTFTALLAGLALLGCDDGASADPADGEIADGASAPDAAPDALDASPDARPDAAAPTCPTVQRWAEDGDDLALWPDPALLVADPSRPTGYRLDVLRAPWADDVPQIVAGTLPDFAVLSGYGRTGGVLFRFTAPVQGLPEGLDATLADDAAAAIFDLSTDPPTRVPFLVETVEAGATVILVPRAPLKPGTRYAAVLGAGVTDLDGGCVEAAPGIRAALAGAGDLAPAWVEALEAGVAALGGGPVAAATAFVTEDDLGPIVAAADSIPDRDYDWVEPPTCELANGVRRCEGAFTAFDFRDDRAILTAEPQPERWTIPVSLWVPEGEGPFPTIIYGHGINSRRQDAGGVARLLNPRGYAVVSIDALRHGEHPTADGSGLAALQFLGVELSGPRVDGLALRGHFNQTVLDRLQLIELLRQAPDLDGDGAPEIDVTRLAYWGISLGGMYGVGTLALSDQLQAGVLSVAGGRLMAFVTETAQIAPFRGALNTLAGGADALQRDLVGLQTLVDAGDPALWGSHVLYDRLRGEAPHVLLPVCLEDGTVPPITGRALARAIGLPQIEPVFYPLEGAEVLTAPVRANVLGRTAGYFQLDRSGDPPVASTHDNTPTGAQGALQALAFLDGWLAGDAVIVDPYAELMTPPLP